MRSFLLTVVALALFASPASAAVIEIEDHFCGCDGSSGEEDTRGLIVRAAPGELNRISVTVATGGVVIEDLGAPLTGACEPASGGSRFCRGEYDGVAVYLGDGSDQVSVQGLAGRLMADRATTTSSWQVPRGCSPVAPAPIASTAGWRRERGTLTPITPRV